MMNVKISGTNASEFKPHWIKKIFYCLLISGFILGLSGGVIGYNILDGGVCECGLNNSEDACVDCNSALNDAQCTNVFLNKSITNYNETCIYDYGNFNNKIFDCKGNTISGNISAEDISGIYLFEQSGNTIKNCVIQNFYYGINLYSASGNTLLNNTLNSGTYGIYMYTSADNNLTGNTLNMNLYGIYLESISIVKPSSNNLLRNNSMNNNTYNFNMDGYDISDYYQDIDTSNMVDGKPVYYLTDTTNAEIPGDAGFVGLISCDNITVKDLNLSKNFYGILLMNTTNSKIINNTVHSNEMGIYLENSPENKLVNNTMKGNTFNFNVLGSDVLHYQQDIDTSNTVEGKPIYYRTYNYSAEIPPDAGFVGLVSCKNITVENLNLSKNSQGILIVNTTNSSIFNNTVHSNIFGIFIYSSEDNEMRNNTMFNNLYNFNVVGSEVSYYHHDVDTTNTVDGNPIYYLIGNSSAEIPSNAGFVALISCDNITVENLNIHNNFQGVLLVDTVNTRILNNSLYSNVNGVYLDSSSNNIIDNNTLVSNSDDGIYLRYSSGNNLTNNTILNSSYGDGIYLAFSTQNILSGNTIRGNLISGVYVDRSDGGNRIYNNTISESTYGVHVDNSGGGMTDNAKNRSYEWYSCNMSNAANYIQGDDNNTEYVLNRTFNYFGRNITKISASTNGFIELLEAWEGCYDCNDYGSTHADGNYRSNMDVIFASNDNLQTIYDSETQYLAICSMDDKIVIELLGSTATDYESTDYQINFQIILYQNGTIEWNFNEMNWANHSYDMFSGLYAKEENFEVTVGYKIKTQGSYYYNQNLSSAVLMGIIEKNNIENNKYGIYLNSSSKNILVNNTLFNNTIGIYSENSNSTVNSNTICGNIQLNFNSTNWQSSYGSNNTCNNTNEWNDTGIEKGCRYTCDGINCDADNDYYVNSSICGGSDCNDNNPNINPDTKWYVDNDNDTYGSATNYTTGCIKPTGNYVSYGLGLDCDDSNASINPNRQYDFDNSGVVDIFDAVSGLENLSYGKEIYNVESGCSDVDKNGIIGLTEIFALVEKIGMENQ